MLHFCNDYSAGAHPVVLDALCRTNLEQTPGYGHDSYCEAAADRIRALCQCQDADVHFLVGGTQVNRTAIGAFLRPYEAVIAASSAHICVHETGAVEADGHKIISCPAPVGMLTPWAVHAAVESHTSEHMVVPRLLYISNSTELGTIYPLSYLRTLRELADSLGLYLYCDGARLGSAIAAGDASFADYAALCDAFTIGGTKNGLLFGEALVIPNPALRPGFRHCMKRQGAVLAKGRLLGVQFNAILEDGLYLQLAAHANAMAQRLTHGLRELGISFLMDSTGSQSRLPVGNLVFPILPDAVVEALASYASFEVQCKEDDESTCIRFVTAWNTTGEDVDRLIRILEELLH